MTEMEAAAFEMVGSNHMDVVADQFRFFVLCGYTLDELCVISPGAHMNPSAEPLVVPISFCQRA